MSQQSTADAYIPQPMTTDAREPQGKGPPNRWHPSTPSGRRWNECRAAGPCREMGCPAPRYVSPGGFAALRCKAHEFELHREQWQARHPGSRPYRRRSPGLDALADAVNAE